MSLRWQIRDWGPQYQYDFNVGASDLELADSFLEIISPHR